MLQPLSPPHLVEQANRLVARHPELSGSLFATSGTTGTPQWIVHSQESLDWCARTINQHFNCTPRDTWGLALPKFHVGGYSLTHRAKLARGKLAQFPDRWHPTAFHHWLKTQEITVTSLVPTQVLDLVKANLKSPPKLRLALIGGEHLAETTFQKALELSWPLVTSYGMTETAGLIAASKLRERTLHPLPGWKLATTTNDTLTIEGTGLFQGHLTDKNFHPTPSPFITKDIVELTPHQITIRGRTDDQIKILGELVDLTNLRHSLATTFPDLQTTVLAFPENRRGHLLIPVINSTSNPSLQEKISHWNHCLPAFSRCEEATFVTTWPLTPLGKLDRLTLSKQVTNERNSLLRND